MGAKIKKGDLVQIISGKERGKQGKVLRVIPETSRVVVEGINVITRHRKASMQGEAGGIDKVEVRIGEGPWQEATLGPDANIDYWRQWYLEWDAPAGQHQLTVRATDLTGAVQPEQRTEPFPRGATGWHTIPVTVE